MARSLQLGAAMNAKANQMAERLKCFATRVVKFARVLPTDGPTQAIAKQLTKSGTSEAANYHAARVWPRFSRFRSTRKNGQCE